jgi:hypothetical protein
MTSSYHEDYRQRAGANGTRKLSAYKLKFQFLGVSRHRRKSADGKDQFDALAGDNDENVHSARVSAAGRGRKGRSVYRPPTSDHWKVKSN